MAATSKVYWLRQTSDENKVTTKTAQTHEKNYIYSHPDHIRDIIHP